jgi:hypothetical protein
MAAKITYARAAVARRAVLALQGAGLEVGGLRFFPDGSFEVITAGQRATAEPANDFDRLDAAGLL